MTSHSVRSVRRERGPTIAWSPRHDAYYVLAGLVPGANQIPPLALTQTVLLEIESLRRRGTSPVTFGLLAGYLCVDPGEKTDYLMVDEVVRSRSSLTTDDPTTELATEIRTLAAEVLGRGKLPIGWYLEGMAGDGAPDRELVELHAELFPEPWQFMLLCDDESVGARDVLIRIERKSQRSYAIPFLELLPRTSERGQTKPRTALRWKNYITSQDVLPLAAPEAAAARTASNPPPTNASARLATWLKTPFRRPTAHDGYRTPSTRSGSPGATEAALKASGAFAQSQPSSEPSVDRIQTPIPHASPAPSKPLAPSSRPAPSNAPSPTVALPEVNPPKVEQPLSAKEAGSRAEGMAPPIDVKQSIATSALGEPPKSPTPRAIAPEPAADRTQPDERRSAPVQKSASADAASVAGLPHDSIAPATTRSRESNDAQQHQPSVAVAAQELQHRADVVGTRSTSRRIVVLGAVALGLVLSVAWYMTRTPSTAAGLPRVSRTATDSGPDADRVKIMQIETAARALVHTNGCSSLGACRTAPVGWRECGGPRLHLVYCAASTDTLALFRKLDELRQAEMEYNEKSGRTGTSCEFRMPPELALQSGGQCTESR